MPIQSDTSIKMILKTHAKMRRLKYNVKIIPVCIHHERLFEASYLANEMISGTFTDITFSELLQNIFGMRQGKLGKVFVKYCDPIDLNSYVD